MTSALHAEGPQFDPGRVYFGTEPQAWLAVGWIESLRNPPEKKESAAPVA